MTNEELSLINLINLLKLENLENSDIRYIKEIENKIIIDCMVLSDSEKSKIKELKLKYLSHK